MNAPSMPPISALALRERLAQLRRERGAIVPCAGDRSALADLPVDIARGLSPSLADRLARLRPWVGKERSSLVAPTDIAHYLGGELIAPGVVRIEQSYPLPLQHGRATLAAAFDVPGSLYARDSTNRVPASDAVFIDTETTGLSGGSGTVAFMIGVARCTGPKLYTTQWVITRFSGERPMLAALSAYLADAQLIVTYNGATFDLPLLRTRFRMHGCADPTLPLAHADLLPWARRNRLNEWPDARIQTLEREGLGMHRVDDLPSADVPKAWRQWLSAGEATPLRRALEHNRLDLVTLLALLERASKHPDGSRRKGDPRQAWLFEQPTPWSSARPQRTAPFIRNPWRQSGPKAIESVI